MTEDTIDVVELGSASTLTQGFAIGQPEEVGQKLSAIDVEN